MKSFIDKKDQILKKAQKSAILMKLRKSSIKVQPIMVK